MEGLSSEELKKAIYKMKPYILHTTVADYEKLPRYRYDSEYTNYVALLPENRLVPTGEGYLDYRTFIGTLKEIGYQGYIAYEMCAELKGGGSVDNLDKTARIFLEYVKQFK
jgi:sugar phosphate isomerase/epimerase